MEKACLDLGLNVCRGHFQLKHNDYHLALYIGGLYDELKRMTQYWDAFFDGPWGGDRLYLKLAEWYPQAYFIQTLRDPDEWYESLYNMIRSLREDESLDLLNAYHRFGCQGSTLFFKQIFGIERIEERTRIIDHYRRINDEVAEFFSCGKYRFLQMNVTEGDGWERLAPFLGVTDPGVEFPKENVHRGVSDLAVASVETNLCPVDAGRGRSPDVIMPFKWRIRRALKRKLKTLSEKL